MRGSAGAPLGEKFAVRVAAYKNELDDQVVNTVDGSRRELLSEGYSAQLLFEPNDGLSFLLEYNRRESEQHGNLDSRRITKHGYAQRPENERHGADKHRRRRVPLHVVRRPPNGSCQNGLAEVPEEPGNAAVKVLGRRRLGKPSEAQSAEI